ncbi:hypothetical protein DNTS_031421 [Danionella cerebrum]|uniref:Cadherin domain-containing protein n=1 Tax=Danionella cerebrum TaxID=2873325 RepID=A0A553MW66_9TELE|nr:hypothetical protein DNTS_031421 [Danionella translucida]TRY57431.1 hypothetical protein DNTS_031421 [Danionella translucida]TRY57432.1 hypothetical protein DNTS_031421 [Danionella translucida]
MIPASIMLRLLALVGMLCLCSTEPLLRNKRSWIIDSFDIVEEHPGPFPYELGQFILKGHGVDEEPKGVLSIDSKTGVIHVHRKVDYEQFSILRLTFQAKNKSNSAIDTQLGMEVNILDINDNPPVFQRKLYNVTIDEAAKQGEFVVGVLAIDKDAPGTPNSTIDYKITSVTPSGNNVEFYIEPRGSLSFKGCLDYELANKYTITIEAKDRGKGVKLSSTATIIINLQDGNNHAPIITGQTPLDYEKQTKHKFTIFAENKKPFFSCEVKERFGDRLWTVVSNPQNPSSRNITITVEDSNDPPFFLDPAKKAVVEENGAIGAFVDKVKAVDPDTGRPHKLE